MDDEARNDDVVIDDPGDPGIVDDQRSDADIAIHLTTACERGISIARNMYAASSDRRRIDPRVFLELCDIAIDLQRTLGDMVTILRDRAMKGLTP